MLVRRHVEAASVGARLLAARALGEDADVDALNPVVARDRPDARWSDAYAGPRAEADRTAADLLAHATPTGEASS